MKSIKLLLSLVLTALLFTYCSKDDDNKPDPNIAEGKLTDTIDGKAEDFTVTAAKYKDQEETTGKDLEYLVISGSRTLSQNTTTSLVLTIYAEKISAKSYDVPSFGVSVFYDYLKGFGMGMYYPSSSDVNNYYYSFMVAGAKGSITITSLTATNVKGTFDMVLVNSADSTKTVKMNGEFNSKVTSYTGNGTYY